MSFLKPRFLAYMIRGLLNILLATCKIRIEGLNEFIETANKGPCILMLWHNRLLIAGHILSHYTSNLTYSAFVSKSRDGEILAQFASSYRNGNSIRVAHNARELALRELIHQLKEKPKVFLITPDGPKGPKYEIKKGIVKAAMATGALSIPWTWSINRFWQLKTWDNLIIPRPFSSIVIRFGKPLHPENSIEETTAKFKESMNFYTEEACRALSEEKHYWPK